MDTMFSYGSIQKLSETEISIYKYIIDNGEKVFYMTIRELAKELNVSTSTIVRFCNKVGCENYSEFKQKLQRENEKTIVNHPKSDLNELLRYFQGTNTSAFEEKISQGADLIRSADMVVFIGQGSSGALANYGARYFSNLGKFSIGLSDTYYPIVLKTGEKMVVIVLSVSGETKEVIDFLAKFQACSAKILSITNEPNSTIAKMSDWNISYYMDLEKVYGEYNATTQVPPMFLIEVLARRM